MPKKELYSYEIEREGIERNMIINCIGSPYYPSIEENPMFFEMVINYIIEAGAVTNVIFAGERNYIYPPNQANMLNEVAQLVVRLLKEKEILKYSKLGIKECRKCAPEWYIKLRDIMTMVKSDPIGAYVLTIRTLRETRAKAKIMKGPCVKCIGNFISILEDILSEFEKLTLIKLAKPEIAGWKIGDREFYRKIFEPLIKPNFMYTRLMTEPPLKAEEIDTYSFKNVHITIYKVPNKMQLLYHIMPLEFQLDEEEYTLLDEARQVLVKYKPKRPEFVDPRRMREIFFNIGKDLVEDIARTKKIKISYEDIRKLAKILVRLTVGFGLIEVLLWDENIEDVYINSPIGSTPIFVKHAKYGECFTNIIPNIKEAEAWASRFRMISGRPLDEANPVLDTELETAEVRARVCITQPPLTPTGYNFAFRRHRPRPWTLPLFMKYKMLSPLAAGVISFLVEGARTMLVAGTRGAGKTSLLSSIITEIMRKYRIITVEDTLELPTEYFRKIGYDVLSMKVRSAIVGEEAEMSAEEGIRTALRLGDSCLIIGEVRSVEAKALYESMRVGALANVVAGTIHGDSPYGVFDRVVNDLGVPRTSFKATDIILIANKLRTPGGIKEERRLTEITEVRKHWEEDPIREKGFVSLMSYNAREDKIKPTKDLLEGESEVIKSIASRVREWSGNWDAVWENILLRARIKELILEYSQKTGNEEILEADFVVEANDMFANIYSEIKEEIGYPESKRIVREFENWLKIKAKKKK